MGMERHSRNIMSEENSVFTRSPFEHCWIVRASDFGILDTDDVQIGFTPKNPSQDVIVEILVEREPKHVQPLAARRARSLSLTPFGL